MKSENIVLIARLKVKKEAVEAAKAAALTIIQPSRDETSFFKDGNINYDFHQAIDDETIFVWHETWKNEAAIDFHGKSAHFKEFSQAVKNFTEEPLRLTFLKMVSEKA